MKQVKVNEFDGIHTEYLQGEHLLVEQREQVDTGSYIIGSVDWKWRLVDQDGFELSFNGTPYQSPTQDDRRRLLLII